MTGTTVGCLRCGVWYDPARPHVCGVIGDDTARRLEELIFETRSWIEGLDRRLGAIEERSHHPAVPPTQDTKLQDQPLECMTGGEAAPVRTPAPPTLSELRVAGPVKQPFDRKRYHAGYMRTWRARRKTLLLGDDFD
jgi:hypothetical protein